MAAKLPLLPRLLCLWSSIEHELLTCVFGAEWFHSDVFGCAFTIESDHKPLEKINIKNMADTPVCQQRMLFQLHTCDATIKFWPSKEIMVADALSHYASLRAPDITLDRNTSSSTMCTSHLTGILNSRLSSKMTCSSVPLLRWSLHVG